MTTSLIIKIVLGVIIFVWMWTGVHYWVKEKIRYTGWKQIIYGPIVWMGIICMFFDFGKNKDTQTE